MSSISPAALSRLEGPGVSVLVGEELALATTLRVGGAAGALVTVDDEVALQRAVEAIRTDGLEMVVLGRGSNMLFSDEGWPGVVLRLGPGLRGIEIEDGTVRVGAAEPMPAVALRTAQAGLSGFAWGAAVPGSMGGGVRMNAGAHGADMSDSLVSARVLDASTGSIEEWDPERLSLIYRGSALGPDSIVTSVTLELEPGDSATILAEIDAIRDWRRTHQPLNLPSCGSVFTNPPGASAGELIERVGLKGTRIGGAEVSTLHANFIVTRPGASAADVESLIDLVAKRVHAELGVELRAEVVRPRSATQGGTR
jgi:UDP-N-acetylmuramate dehydrogenase